MTNDQSSTPKNLRRAYISNVSSAATNYSKTIITDTGYYIHVRDDELQTVSFSGLRQFPLVNDGTY